MTDAFFDKLRRLMSAKDAAELQNARPFLLELLEMAEVPVEEAEELVINAILDWVEHDREPGLVHFVDARCREYASEQNIHYQGLQETHELVKTARRARGVEEVPLRPLAPRHLAGGSPARRSKKMGRGRGSRPKK